jgi:hypothetical protein
MKASTVAVTDVANVDVAAVAAESGSAITLHAAFDLAADAGHGIEGTDRDSFAVPFLRVLQKSSPQCDEANAAYNAAARPGMLYNSVTGSLYDGKTGVTFLPCSFQRRFLKWAPRGTNGGFRGELTPEAAADLRDSGGIVELEGRLYIPTESGEVSDKKCERVSDTRSHFGLVVHDGKVEAVLLALTSTQIKKSKTLMTLLAGAKTQVNGRMITPPTWLNKIRLTTVAESNDQGSWHGVKFEADGFIDSPDLYAAGRDFHAATTSGERKANYADVADHAEESIPGQF